jgi:hypothetical protein
MPEEIDVLESTHLLLKVNTLNKLSPARVEIKYGAGQVVPRKETKAEMLMSYEEKIAIQLKQMLKNSN